MHLQAIYLLVLALSPANANRVPQSLLEELTLQEVCDKEHAAKLLHQNRLSEDAILAALLTRCLNAEEVIEAAGVKTDDIEVQLSGTARFVRAMVRFSQEFYTRELPEIAREAEFGRNLANSTDTRAIRYHLSAETRKTLDHFIYAFGMTYGYLYGVCDAIEPSLARVHEKGLPKKKPILLKSLERSYEPLKHAKKRFEETSNPICAELSRVLYHDYCQDFRNEIAEAEKKKGEQGESPALSPNSAVSGG